jgi:phosphoribosyl 1,2-cyclic phosphodiesterase
VDAGLSRRETLRRMAALGVTPASLDAILITHEHTDHCSGLASLLCYWKTCVYLTAGTAQEIERLLSAAKPGERMKLDRAEYVTPGQQFQIGDISIVPFRIPHDAADPVAFAFRAGGAKLAVVTDLGYLPELVKVHLIGSDMLVLESNHDLEMLKVGPYPWHVKQRVMSRTGHLSNFAVSEFLADAESFDARPRHLVLAHLSENNNHPEVARLSAEQALVARPLDAPFSGELHIASQRAPLGPFLL